MNEKIKFFVVVIVGLLITFLAYFLRLQQFSSFPPINDTRDEYKYAFNGISLIKKGVPESWSWFDDYKTFEIRNIRGSNYRMVRPYFEDPPLFGLMVGSYAISKGMDSYEKVDSGALRWPMLKLGAFNVFLLYFLVYLFFGFGEAVLSGLFFATVPTIVLSSRLPLAENFLITLSLSSLIAVYFYFKKRSKLALLLVFIFSFAASLVKQTGMFIPVSIFFLFLFQNKIKPAFLVLFFFFLSLTFWFFYGYYYNWDLFWQLQAVAAGREILLPNMVIHLFDTFRISEKAMPIDGLMIWGWISLLFCSVLKEKENQFSKAMVVFIGTYLVLFAVMSGHMKGWYRFPLYPFLSWAMAKVFIEIYRSPRFLMGIFFITIPVLSGFISGTGETFLTSPQVKIYQILIPLLTLPFLAYEIKRKVFFMNISRVVLVLTFFFLIWMNIRTVLYFQDQFWY